MTRPITWNKNAHISINADMAERIIESTRKTVAYDINIMNEEGFIIASSNHQRIGSFHEVAFQILNTQDDTLETIDSEEFIGTRNGINTVLKYKGFQVGVLGITGDPDEVRPLIHILKLAVEAMIASEFQQYEHALRSSQRSMFEGGLLHGSETEVELMRWATELNIDHSAYRIPIWVKIDSEISITCKTMLIGVIAHNQYFSDQDLIMRWESSGLVIFKTMPHQTSGDFRYKHIISEFLEEFLSKLRAIEVHARVYVGTFCKRLERYHEAYKRALWVYSNSPQNNSGIVFFYDYVDDWAKSFIPVQELHDVCGYFISNCDDKLTAKMTTMRNALVNCNYNLGNASQQLYIHKNTLYQWMNNLKNTFSIDPMNKVAERSFWELLCYCLRDYVK